MFFEEVDVGLQRLDVVVGEQIILELKAVAALAHPNILVLYDIGWEQGVPFAVTELLEGASLRNRIDSGPVPWREAFAEALTNYEQRNLEFAQMGFQRVLELKADDGPAKFYLERITELSQQQLPDNWVTHTILKEK